MSADAAVVVVSYNTAHLMGECLDSLDKERGTLAQQVVVIDNGSGDGSVEVIRERGGVELIDAGRTSASGAPSTAPRPPPTPSS